ncbi:TetR/AcrR family transcriptional regulator [Peterkaempfera sp. SMS 1(5)a]|uniref:TetR/AcrR family transcriptional regulator n=1 Tax=Peterkaempfera podocarpi TaxID=3232308 RepID=UPI003670CAFD
MSPTRPALIADTAVELLAERGLRGLTHRAVDEAAGLPQGSTSNHARTRAALLALTLDRLAELERRVLAPDEVPVPRAGVPGLADALALALHRSMTEGRVLLLARLELALEATRRPELRQRYDELGRGFREPLAGMLGALGSAEPERHARLLVSWCEGVLFYSVAGAASVHPPDLAELRSGAAELLAGMLGTGR